MTTETILLLRKPGLDRDALDRACSCFAGFASALARRRGLPFFDEIDVIFHNDAASAAAHGAVMGVPTPTDVITVPYAAMPGEPARAELLVNPLEALRRASRRGTNLLPEERAMRWSADLELALYVAHGFDHLAGSDDAAPSDFRAMRRRELRWLSRLPFKPVFFKRHD